ncbi:MAG: endolytic transglycosylase MltG [Anaerosomatales bacterium]|nr:endolytic transglycosylase MltG [Anaerosomatales bacterium]
MKSECSRDERRVPRPARRRPVPEERLAASGETPVVGRLHPEERMRRRKTLLATVVLVGILIAVGVPAFTAYTLLLKPDVRVEAGRPVTVTVPEGSGTADIARILAQAGVVENAQMFRLRARLDGVDGTLKPGTYELATRMPYDELVKRLVAGPPVAYVDVTIPEGFTVDQIAARLEEKAGVPADEFLALAKKGAERYAAERPYLRDVKNGSLEGYLFPKTYRLTEGMTADDVVRAMLDQFDTEIAQVDLSYAASKNLTLHDVVIIASMVEREARLDRERPLVSSVIYNRLRKGMKLEIDATIEYILPGNRPRLLNKHLKIDSPYNTYLYPGLPIGPISNPGLASLKAAAQPADTSYLYYVLTSKDGSHTFCTTYEEFQRAKAKSKEVVP